MGRRQSLFQKLEDRIVAAGDAAISEAYSRAIALTAPIAISGRRSDHDEVAHVAALKLLTIDGFDGLPNESQEALARTVTKRTHIDADRSARNRARAIESEIEATDQVHGADLLVDQEQQQRSEAWIKELDDKDQRLLQLKREGLTIREIAECLGTPKSSVQYRVAKLADAFFANFGE